MKRWPRLHTFWQLGMNATLGRFFVAFCPSSFNLPRLRLWNESDWIALSFTYGNGNSDPALQFDITLKEPSR